MTAGGAHARALEDRIRALLHEHADRIEPGDGLPAIRARIRRPWWRRALAHLTASKTAARGATRTAATAAPLGGTTAMDTVQREAQQLRPDDIITRHPDHPDRQVWYRVARWPRRVSHAQVLVDYTTRPEQLDGDTFGVLVLDIDQECRVIPAHTQGGQA